VLEIFRPGSRRLLAGVTVASGTLLAAACGSSGGSATDAGSTPSPVTARSSSPVTTAAPAMTTALGTTTVPATTASTLAPAPTAAPPPTAAAAVSTGCTALAARTFLHVTAVRAAADGSLTLTAHRARLACGGPDDSHFTVAPTAVTAHVIPGASITVFPVSDMHPDPIRPAALPAYLASDRDTRTFLVTGPLGAISSLQEQFHP